PALPQYDLACQLLPSAEAPGESSCSMSAEREFGQNDEYRVSLRDASAGRNLSYTVFPAYLPCLHSECDPPSDLQSGVSASKCRLQWKKPAAYDLMDSFRWQLAFKATAAPWQQAQTRSFVSGETWAELEGAELEPGVRYVARLRLRLSGDYGSEWSPWSPTSEWAAPPGWQPPASPPLVLLVSLPLGLGALLVLLLALRALSRTRGSGGTPTPATFFQPLYTSHKGNFQHWAGLKEGGGWLRSGLGHPPGKGDGAAAGRAQPWEAPISPLSILLQPPKATAQEGALLPPPGAPDWPYLGSSGYEVLGVQAQVPPGQEGEAQLQGLGWPHKGPQQAPCWGRESGEDYCTLGGGCSQQSSAEQLPRLQGLAAGGEAPHKQCRLPQAQPEEA
ncbi:hypothetical protein lerEdw1_007642, partial [Lerista edwardsae]